MSEYAVIPGGPSPEMNPGCSGPFIILDPESACLYVWDAFAKQYVAFCLDDSGAACEVDEIPLTDGSLLLTCTPGQIPQEGKASVINLLTEFFSALCALDGVATHAEIVQTEGPIGEGSWCIRVDVLLGEGLTINQNNEITINIGDGSGGIGTDPLDGSLTVDICQIEDALLSSIIDSQLCSMKVLGQYVGAGSECLTRNFDIGELTSRFIEAGSNITLAYDPATCKTTITGADAPPVALTPGHGTAPGDDGSSLDLDLCSMTYVGAAPDGSRTVICTGGTTVLADYVAGGSSPGGGVVIVGGGEGVDVDTVIVDGDVTYTISLDLCDVPTSLLAELQNATEIFIPLCVDGLSRKYSSEDFTAAISPTIAEGQGIDVTITKNPGGSNHHVISLDSCFLPQSVHVPDNQEIVVCSAGDTVKVPAYKGGDGITIGSDGVISNDQFGTGAPTGIVTPFAGADAPGGWLLCNGATYFTSDKSALYAVIGNTYGGDATSFRLPDLRGRTARGVNNMGGSEGPGYPGRTILGAVGGSPALSILTTNMPNHSHTGTVDAVVGHTHGGSTSSSGAHSHNTTGGGGSHTHTVYNVPYNLVDGMQGGPMSVIGGFQNHTTSSEGSHSHSVTSTGSSHSHGLSMNASGGHTHGMTTNASGGGNPIEQASPFIDLNYIIKE